MTPIPAEILATVADLSPADAAAALSVPTLRTRGGRVTFTTLTSVWGFARAVQFVGMLDGMSKLADPATAAAAQLAIRVLGGDGFEPGNAQAAVAAEMFVAAGLATANEVRDTQYDLIYPAGAPVTADDVTAARAIAAARAAVADERAGLMGYVNEVLNVAEAGDPAAPRPTLAEYLAARAAGGDE